MTTIESAEELHKYTRGAVATTVFLCGAVVLGYASGTEFLRRHTGVEPWIVRAFIGAYAASVLGATLAFHARGFRDRVYSFFNKSETAVLVYGSTALIVLGGNAKNLLWLLYFASVVHSASAALFRRYNTFVFASAAVLTTLAFAVLGQVQDALLSACLSGSALSLYALFLRAADARDALVAERDALRERLRDNAIAEERVRIARDLHDGLGATLNAAIWQMRRLPDQGATSALEQRLMTCMDELGAIVWTMRRERADSREFALFARARCEELFGGEVQLEFSIAGKHAMFDARTTAAALNILFEGVRNAIRHARCDCVRVSLGVEAAALMLRVEDDGKGFDAAGVREGHGLRHMRERASAVGASLSIARAEKGMRIEVRFPLLATEAASHR